MRLSLNTGPANATEIFSGPTVFQDLNDWLEKGCSRQDPAFILADSNTRAFCLPHLLSLIPSLQNAVVLEMPPGESVKSIDSTIQLWAELAGKGASRRSLLINLGGGVITDLGGFVASTFKRGIPFIHIPTTLLGMVDAAIGGKTGINLGNIKNQVGTFYLPEAIFIYPAFLGTLSEYELHSGFAEIIKIALVADSELWQKLLLLSWQDLLHRRTDQGLEDLIYNSVKIKCRIVEQDFKEMNLREILNFGHTIGHAFESLSFKKNSTPISHGHAIALGMICEGYLSGRKTGFEAGDRDVLTRMILSRFKYFPIQKKDADLMMDTMVHDKKRRESESRFTLLKEPGNAIPGIVCNPDEIVESLEYYKTLGKE
jgi:3-dehydroquinate synthase